MKDKLFQLFYDMVRAIISSKDFVPFCFSLIKKHFYTIVVCFLFGIAIICACLAFTGCVMGDKAVQEITSAVKECVNGICYEKNKL